MTMIIAAASVATMLTLTACKELVSNIEEDFSYWASEPVITGFTVDAPTKTQMNKDNVLCVPSGADVTFTLAVHNPKDFTFIMPDGSEGSADIVTFQSGVHDSSGTNPPVHGTDYTLVSSSDGKEFKLTYKAAFLKRYEWSSANIGASIRLYGTDGRKFNQTYSFNLEANTPPPDPAPYPASADSHIALFKTGTPSNEYYVLCFKVDGLPGENVLSGGRLHKDITQVCVSKDGGAETRYPVALKSDYTDFDISQAGGTFIGKTTVAPLASTEAAELSGNPLPDAVPSGPWVLYLKTDVAVGGVPATYGIRLFDGKLYSARAEQTIGKRTLPEPKVFAHEDIKNVAAFGVYTEGSRIVTVGSIATVDTDDLNGGGALIGGFSPDGSDEAHAIPVYSAYGETVKLTIKKDGNDYPAGVTVRGSAEKVSGDAVSPSFTPGQSAIVTLPAPTAAGGEAVYKVVCKASGEGFDDSTPRTLYYKVRREIKAVNNLPVWYMLQAAIEKIPLGGSATVKISGTLKAENISYPQLPDGSSVVNNTDIEVSGKRDSGDYPGRTVTVIGDAKASSILDAATLCSVFNIEFNGKLILKNVTLQNAKNDSGGMGGGIYIGDNGSSCEMTDTDIKNCTVGGTFRLGGAVYVRIDGSLTVGSGCGISNNTAPGGYGAGIYVESGGTFNISGDAKIDEGNDVYLSGTSPNNAKITVTGPLTGTHVVAKITPEDYTAGIAAVNAAAGVDFGDYASKFTITDQQNSSPPPATLPWKLIYNGTALVLKPAAPITVNGSDPNAWKTLKAAIEAPTVGDDDEFFIKGTIQATNDPDNSGDIKVTKNITIKKAEDATLAVLDANKDASGKPKHRIFTVESGGELTLENLTLTGGMAEGTEEGSTGGGILVKERCKAKLKNCTVKACEAAEKGGGIYSLGELTLDTSTIGGEQYYDGTVAGKTKGNQAKRGGGIYSEKGTIDVSAGSFIRYNKTAGSSGREAGGGGIFIRDGKLTLSGTVSDNTALNGTAFVSGGGVYVGTEGEFIMKTGAVISGNTSRSGGGVYIDAWSAKVGTFTMKGGTISGCKAGGSGFSDAQGGGVYISDEGTKAGIFTMEGGSITDCTAEATSAGGGGVYADSGAVFKMSGDAVITPSTQANTATIKYNDVYLSGTSSDNAKITLDGMLSPEGGIAARITPNSYTVGKKLLQGEDYTLTASDAGRFSITPETEGGVTYEWELIRGSENFCELKKGDVIIPSTGDNPWKELKTAVEEGSDPVIIIDGSIQASSANSQIKVTRSLTIKGKTGRKHDELDAGNLTYIFEISGDGKLTLENLTLKNGRNTGAGIPGGGAIYCAGAELTTKNICIENCTAKNGGGIYVKEVSFVGEDTGSTITLNNTQITACSAQESGGGIYSHKSTLTMTDCTIGGEQYYNGTAAGKTKGNKAKNGGGVYISGTDTSFTMTGGLISANTADSHGGGVYVSGTFVMAGSAAVTPSTGSDENAAGKNDVYLANDKMITVSGTLSNAHAARITVPDAAYNTSTQVLDGSAVGTEYTKFTVTPQISPAQTWSVDSNGYLKMP